MTDTEIKSWDEMTPEEQADYQRQSDRNYKMYLYNQYGAVVDAITSRYDVPWDEALDAANSFVTDLEEQAAEEAREEANSKADEIAEEIAAGQDWMEQSNEDDLDENAWS